MKRPALGLVMQRGGRVVTFCKKPSTLRYRSTLKLRRTARSQVRPEAFCGAECLKYETTPGVHHSYICLHVMRVLNVLDASPAVLWWAAFPWLWRQACVGPRFRLKMVSLACWAYKMSLSSLRKRKLLFYYLKLGWGGSRWCKVT